jgi:hypothetical protein
MRGGKWFLLSSLNYVVKRGFYDVIDL